MFGKGGEDLGQYGKDGILFGVLGVGKETRPELGPGEEVFISKGGVVLQRAPLLVSRVQSLRP